MESSTLGKRIAQQRNKLGLTQEALAEKLDISPNTVASWEADCGFPEIDELIALSKILSVTTDWLLCAESKNSTRPGLSPQDLKAIDTMIKGYQTPPKKNRSGWFSVVCSILALVIAVGCWLRPTSTPEPQKLPDYQPQLQELQDSLAGINAQLSDFETRLQDLEQGDKLLTEYEILCLPGTDWTELTVSFQAVPYTWQEGDTAAISLRHRGEEIEKVNCAWDDTAFSAEIALNTQSLLESYESFFVLTHADGTQEQQDVSDSTLLQLGELMLGYCEVVNGDVEVKDNQLAVYKMNIWVQAPALYEKNGQKWDHLDLALYLNGTLLTKTDLLSGQAQDSLTQHIDLQNITYELPAGNADDVLELRVEGQLDNGYPVQYDYLRFSPDENGNWGTSASAVG